MAKSGFDVQELFLIQAPNCVTAESEDVSRNGVSDDISVCVNSSDSALLSSISSQDLKLGIGDSVENVVMEGNSDWRLITACLMSCVPSSIPCKPAWVEVTKGEITEYSYW